MHNAYLSTVSVYENGLGQEYAQEAFCDYLARTMERSWTFREQFFLREACRLYCNTAAEMASRLSSSHDLKKIAIVYQSFPYGSFSSYLFIVSSSIPGSSQILSTQAFS